MTHCYKFESDFGSDEYIPYNVGRLRLASGAVIRIVFCEEGIKMLVPDECKTNGDFVFLSDPLEFIRKDMK